MKIYQNAPLGFEMEIPDVWQIPIGVSNPTSSDEPIRFGCPPNLAFNIIVGPLIPEPSMEATENKFRKYADHNEYTELEFGRLTIENKEHVWARYHMGPGDLTKKYMLVFNETEYAITATCFDYSMFVKNEQIWDGIIASFQLLTHLRSFGKTERMLRAAMIFEVGHNYFKSERFQEALEQFERGKILDSDYPSNFLGISMTIMQMIEMKKIPDGQVNSELKRAEKNVLECLRIAPHELDYQTVYKVIREVMNKHK